MRAKRSSAPIPLCLTASIVGLLAFDASAQENINRNGWFFAGVAGGYGLTHVNTGGGSGHSEGTFALGFRGGYAISSSVVTGLELNGWTLEAYDFNDPSKGESLGNVSVFINYFPFPNSPIYVSGGAGQTSYTNNSSTVNGRGNGGSWFVVSGYEYRLTRKVSLAPQLRYSQGNFTGGNFKVYEIALGINWYSGD